MTAPSRVMELTEQPAESILILDDEERVRKLLGRIVSDAGYDVHCAGTSQEARELLSVESCALALVDIKLPDEDGLDLLREIVRAPGGTAAIIISGIDDPGVAANALELGAYGYVTKPFTPAQVVIAVANALRRRELERLRADHQALLEGELRQRTASLRDALQRLEATVQQLDQSRQRAVRRLAHAIEYRDPYTHGHVERMSNYVGIIAERVGLDPASLRAASAMHDVGKIALRDSILMKPGPLTPAERAEMQRHTEIGFELLYEPDSNLLRMAATIALTHHERWDGQGYPRGLTGAEIPIEGRVAAIADVFDALTTDRVYRPALPVEEAAEAITAERGLHFDPAVIDAFEGVLPALAATPEQPQESVVSEEALR